MRSYNSHDIFGDKPIMKLGFINSQEKFDWMIGRRHLFSVFSFSYMFEHSLLTDMDISALIHLK